MQQHTRGWSRVSGASGASQRETDGLDSSALGREGASPGWREKLGVSLFPERRGRLSGQGIVCLECTCCFEIFSPLKTAVVGELDAVGRAGSNWVALRGFVSSYCRPLSWGLGTSRIRSAQNAGRRGGVAVCCFVKVTHPPFDGSIPFAAPSAIGSLDRHMLSARLLLEGG